MSYVVGTHLAVEVPATSANLGPGYDALGVALDVHLRVVSAPRQEWRVRTEGEGAGELATGDSNLVWRALAVYCDWAGVALPEVSLTVHNPIPLARGMGSSAAAAVAGVVLGRALTGGGGRDSDLLDLVADLEGHVDNAAAALMGGLCIVVPRADGRCRARRVEPTDALRPVICVPPSRQTTREARALVPPTVSLHDAAANGARTALVFAGLAGAIGWEPDAMVDVLHEPARLEAMAPSGALVAALRDAGIAACLSGAGPSVLAIVGSRDRDRVDRIRTLAGREWIVRPLRWDRSGARLRPAEMERAQQRNPMV